MHDLHDMTDEHPDDDHDDLAAFLAGIRGEDMDGLSEVEAEAPPSDVASTQPTQDLADRPSDQSDHSTKRTRRIRGRICGRVLGRLVLCSRCWLTKPIPSTAQLNTSHEAIQLERYRSIPPKSVAKTMKPMGDGACGTPYDRMMG